MHFSSWTLRSRLIALTTTLVAATSIVIGGVVSLVVSNTLTAQFNDQVHGAVRNAQMMGQSDQTNRFLDDGDVIVAVYAPALGYAVGEHQGTGEPEQLPRTAYSAIRSGVPVQDAGPGGGLTTIDVPGYGEYRFAVAIGDATNAVVYVGRPTSILTNSLLKYLVPIFTVVVLAVLLSGVIGALVIGRALRPLRRVSAVASNVASLPLERDDVELPERVPTEDTNPNTEVGQVGAALNNLLDSVQTALAVRQASEEKVRHFVADASHELRTPLASIRGYAELTRRFGGPLTEDVQHNIGRIESEAMRMTSLVEDLLLLARLDAEREIETRDVDLSRMLVDVLSDANAAGPDHEWELDLPDEPVMVRGDEAKLQQVFTNLLANARVHTPAGTRVVLELAAPRDGHVLARVRDDGPGIPEQLRPQLFGRFVRGDSSRARTTGSTGLGLAIVNAVVQAHHGTVSVASEPGATVFTVQLPVEQPAVAQESAQQPQPA
ncbi:two-component system sensor histidine kinase TcrY [Amnibacterium soli]|uniref:histidine kinase n=1 Tax=Amnibacterium soli TaxID=1282736 RepID=A0ABP8ZFW7_9MICO